MNDIPKPSGYDVYWEKWIDAFEEEEEAIENETLNMEQLLTDNEEILDQENFYNSVSHIKSIITPFGILPLTEQTKASNHFKLWVGHSNFKLTEDFYKIIGQQPGIEALDILTPYRFRIAVGKMFVDREVMAEVRNEMIKHFVNNIHPVSRTNMDLKDNGNE